MSQCRFEDRLCGQARVLHGLRTRVTARASDELSEAFARIESARRSGYWVALLLEYELGEWLEPTLQPLAKPTPARATQGTQGTQGTPAVPQVTQAGQAGSPRLTALIFDHMSIEAPWTTAGHPTHSAAILSIEPAITREAYIQRVEQLRAWIADGEVYQVNTTLPLTVRTSGNAQTLYRQIASLHPSAHAAYIEDDARTVLSFSPELFLQRSGQTLITRPMKGTAPRSADPAQDKRLGAELLASLKNRAENLMIVDLLRNDLGRIALSGSVRADPLFSLERYPSVWTMTSTVQAALQDNTTFESILRALFPCGSVTGAPKIAAMKKIQQTDPQLRGLYCGSLGWMAPSGDFSLNVAIRTLVMGEDGVGTYGVGGGIVHDSDPAQEWEECHWKARVLT